MLDTLARVSKPLGEFIVMSSEDSMILLHNPSCSKSREATKILQEAGVEYSERPYLDAPLSKTELLDLKAKLGRPVREWMRKKDDRFAEAGLDDESTEDELVAALEREPALMERPILIRGSKAIIGRPPELIRGLF